MTARAQSVETLWASSGRNLPLVDRCSTLEAKAWLADSADELGTCPRSAWAVGKLMRYMHFATRGPAHRQERTCWKRKRSRCWSSS